MSEQSLLLHEEALYRTPYYGARMAASLTLRATTVLNATDGRSDPNISVVIRTKNDEQNLELLFEDIEAQKERFFGEIETIVVDTESTDRTVQVAKSHGAEVVPIRQKDFSYPYSLNRGFEATSHPYVFSFVGHSNLSNVCTFSSVKAHTADGNLGGAYGTSLPNKNATIWERTGAVLLKAPNVLKQSVQVAEDALGLMATNCCVVVRDAWEDVGGFDEMYGAGGEDGALGRAFLAQGYHVYIEPLLSVYHTHGLGPIGSLKQLLYWRSLTEPRPFDAAQLRSYRPELRD